MTELFTCKGRYEAGEEITLRLHCDEGINGAALSVYHLSECVLTLSFTITRSDTKLVLPALPEGGYGVTAMLIRGSAEQCRVSTAVNVGGNVVRYGFLSDFQPEDDTDVECMAKYHIDHVQFYDWSYRHDTLIAPTDEYTDMMGKRNSLPVIRRKIAACHERGMLALAYGAVYAASRAFRDAHPEWGLYAAANKPLAFIGTFYYMNIESPWREHLFTQYIDAVERVGFDGVHMDTYGEPKRALTSDGTVHEIETALPTLIADADRAMRESGHIPHLIFNNVGAWPARMTCCVPQDAVYMELWKPMNRYRHLRQAVLSVEGCGQPIVLAAYPAPFRTDTPLRAMTSELILSFAIALLGATQLFLGEKDAVVTQGYYADYTTLLPWQADRIKTYQDFFVRYQELLFDPSLKDVSLTHCGGDNNGYDCDCRYTMEGEPDRLWLTLREDGESKLIGLVNLCGVGDDHWDTGKETPEPLEGVSLRVLRLSPPDRVWFASPDEDDGAARMLPFSCDDADDGIYVNIPVPKLGICGLIWLGE